MNTARTPLPLYRVTKGIRTVIAFPAEHVKSALGYKARPEDIFVVNYPKCGSTWTQMIVLLILNEGMPPKDLSEFYRRSPYLEALGQHEILKMVRPGAIKTHFKFTDQPYHREAKYIYVVRNPKDACVSHFYHTRNLPAYKYKGEFSEYFELWINGQVDYGDYFEHVISWWKHRSDSNVLLLTYEQMKTNMREAVLKIASFLGTKYRYAVHNEEVMQQILTCSSVDYMKKFFNEGFENIFNGVTECPEDLREMAKAFDTSNCEEKKVKFIRKGVVNDWRNYLSEEQDARLMKKLEDAHARAGILAAWGENLDWIERCPSEDRRSE